MTVALLLCFLSLGYRLLDLQSFRHNNLREQARRNVSYSKLIEPRRGQIKDAKGKVLVASRFVKTVCADPTLIGNFQNEVAKAIAPLLMDPPGDYDPSVAGRRYASDLLTFQEKLAEKLRVSLRETSDGRLIQNRYVVLKRKVSIETWDKINQVMANLSLAVDEEKLPAKQKSFLRNLRSKAIFTERKDDQLRYYPNGKLAGHVLGYVGAIKNEYWGEDALSIAGQSGIEKVFNDYLTGVSGSRQTERYGSKGERFNARSYDNPAESGLNIYLTIDSRIQGIAERALLRGVERHNPDRACVIVTQPITGEILAMASYPDYDPTNPGDYSVEARRNMAVSDAFEPGSTFKVLVAAAALNENIVSMNEVFDCENGAFRFAGKTLNDTSRHGLMSVKDILIKSSNIGSAKIALKMGKSTLYDYLLKFGLRQSTGVHLTGESRGILYPSSQWSDLSLTRIAMGHEVSATPLQMTMAMGAIANGGWLMAPKLVKRLEDESGKVISEPDPIKIRRVIQPSVAWAMSSALSEVVSSHGTAPRADLEYFQAAGKTGTAQKPSKSGGYANGQYFSSFIGFFPSDNPGVCIGVFIDRPKKGGYYGGVVSGPVFKEIADETGLYLGITPDRLGGSSTKAFVLKRE
jgi:cell division protein FtsI/penicillin-binding protein 2